MRFSTSTPCAPREFPSQNAAFSRTRSGWLGATKSSSARSAAGPECRLMAKIAESARLPDTCRLQPVHAFGRRDRGEPVERQAAAVETAIHRRDANLIHLRILDSHQHQQAGLPFQPNRCACRVFVAGCYRSTSTCRRAGPELSAPTMPPRTDPRPNDET